MTEQEKAELEMKGYKDLEKKLEKSETEKKTYKAELEKAKKAFEEFKLSVPEPIEITKVKVNNNFEYVDLSSVVKYEVKGESLTLLLLNTCVVSVGKTYVDKVLKILESLGWEV